MIASINLMQLNCLNDWDDIEVLKKKKKRDDIEDSYFFPQPLC